MSEQTPHTLSAEIILNDVMWSISCPYEAHDPERPCLVVEPSDCRERIACGGFEHEEFGHVHRGVGCALIEYFDADQWDAVPWEPDTQGELYLPAKITLKWETGGYPTIRLVPEPTFGDRIKDGGVMGTIVRCSECGGSGQLHDPDEKPPVAIPEE